MDGGEGQDWAEASLRCHIIHAREYLAASFTSVHVPYCLYSYQASRCKKWNQNLFMFMIGELSIQNPSSPAHRPINALPNTQIMNCLLLKQQVIVLIINKHKKTKQKRVRPQYPPIPIHIPMSHPTIPLPNNPLTINQTAAATGTPVVSTPPSNPSTPRLSLSTTLSVQSLAPSSTSSASLS